MTAQFTPPATLDSPAVPIGTEAASALASVLPPTPEEIDQAILDFESAQRLQKAAKETFDQVRDRLVFLADSFGHRPAHAEQSLRLLGKRNTVTVTRGTTVSVDESAVLDFELFLSNAGLYTGLFPKFFARQIKHSLIEGAKDVLKTITLPRRTEEKIASLFGRCVDLKTKAPTVKVDTITPEKPARKPRAKAAA